MKKGEFVKTKIIALSLAAVNKNTLNTQSMRQALMFTPRTNCVSTVLL